MIPSFITAGLSPVDYINRVKNERVKQELKRRFQEYPLKEGVVADFERVIRKCYVVAFVTSWSPECRPVISTLAKLYVSVKNDSVIFKIVDFDEDRDLSEMFGIYDVPTLVVYDENRREIGRFTEKTRRHTMIEEDIASILAGR